MHSYPVEWPQPRIVRTESGIFFNYVRQDFEEDVDDFYSTEEEWRWAVIAWKPDFEPGDYHVVDWAWNHDDALRSMSRFQMTSDFNTAIIPILQPWKRDTADEKDADAAEVLCFLDGKLMSLVMNANRTTGSVRRIVIAPGASTIGLSMHGKTEILTGKVELYTAIDRL